MSDTGRPQPTELDTGIMAVVRWCWTTYREHLELLGSFAVVGFFALTLELSLDVVESLFAVRSDLTIELTAPAELLPSVLPVELFWVFALGVVGNALLVGLAVLSAMGIAFLVAVDTTDHRQRSFADRLTIVSRRLPALVAAMLLAGCLVAVGLVVLVVPGLYLAAKFLLAGPAIVIDGRGPIEGLETAWAASSGRVVELLGVGALGGLALVSVEAVPYIGPVVSVLVVAPVIALGLASYYLDARESIEPAH